ncbi:MAG: MarR family transcriptional regulator [Coriobacteriales bacterium]|nr:MarR family transcriptional regulator [Coriobacteriales bacterium]
MDAHFEGFVTAIAAANKEITRIKTNEMRRFGLKAADVMLLYHLEQAPEGIPAAELARRIGVDRAVVSRSLAGLAREGFVIAEQGASRYNAPVRLTETGQMVSAELNEIIEKAVSHAVEGISAEDRDIMMATLKRIVANLQGLSL